MIQKAGLRILNSFTHENLRTFVDLCKEAGYPTDLGGYYLRQLVRGDYLSKGERGEYVLTPKGRRYLANKLKQTNDVTPRALVMIVARYNNKLVIIERNKQPFLGRKEWPASAIRGGETVEKAVERLLHERIAPASKIMLKGTFRRIDIYQNEVFDDKVFIVHEVTLRELPTVEVSNGKNVLIDEEEIPNISAASKSLKDIFEFVQSNESFRERSYILDKDYFFS